MTNILTVSARLKDIPAGIWALGFVSMLMDISSEMIHALLPIYLVTVLGTTALTVGIIEGIAEATDPITKSVSRVRLSDWLGTTQTVGGHRLWTCRGAPNRCFRSHQRSAGSLPPRLDRPHRQRYPGRATRRPGGGSCACRNLRGASFGLRQSLDTVGAFVGPALAIRPDVADGRAIPRRCSGSPSFRPFWRLALVLFAVHEPARPAGLRNRASSPLILHGNVRTRTLPFGGGRRLCDGRSRWRASARHSCFSEPRRWACRLFSSR